MAQLSRKALHLLNVKRLLHPHISVSWMSTYKAVIFDMYGVLIPLPKATEWEDKNGVPRGTIGQAIRTGGDGNTWRKYMRGELGPEEFVKAFSQDCSQIVGFGVHIGSFHSALISKRNQPFPIMLEAVQCAHAEGFKTAVLTNNFLLNGGESYMPLDPSLFDVIVESCRVGLCKPDPRMYQMCADRLGVLPQEAVFLDDLDHNVEAAVQLGMHGIKVKDPALAVKELEQVLKVPLSGFVPGTRSVRQNQQLLIEGLTQYLNRAIQLPQTDPITVRQFSHRHSNSIYLLSCGGRQLVLKKKANTEALKKEYRLLKALTEAGVPVPDVIAHCEVTSVIGTPFYLRSYCQGRVFSDPSLPGLDAEGKKCVYNAIIKTLCQIHRVDPKISRPEDLGDQEDIMEFEVKRWAHQYKAHETLPIPAMTRLIEWLLSHLPKQQRRTLLHGNFSLNNLVFDSETPDVKAVLGWDLSIIGDPLLDVASCCMSHYLPPNTTQPGNKLATMGIPSAEELFELYSKAMGLESIPHWQFYMAFSFFRQAVILQTNHTKSLKGTTGTRHVEDMAELAWVFAAKEGFRIFNALPRASGF